MAAMSAAETFSGREMKSSKSTSSDKFILDVTIYWRERHKNIFSVIRFKYIFVEIDSRIDVLRQSLYELQLEEIDR